jgi:hypothetical protein
MQGGDDQPGQAIQRADDQPQQRIEPAAGSAWEAFITSPHVGTGVVVLGVLTGFLGSIYTNELKDIVQDAISLTPTGGAWLFLASVVLTVFLVFKRQRVIDRNREKVQKRFDKAATDIPELVRTLPEAGFQGEFGIVFEKAASLLRNLTDIPSRAAGVNVLLQGFAALAGKFDGGRTADRFAANLMVYVEGEAMKPWLAKVKFYDRDPNKLAGLLVLPGEFAATATAEDDLPEFALPVPQDIGTSTDAGGTGWCVLPGAPFAHCRNQFEHYATTSELDDWCRDFGDFTEVEMAAIRKHFADHADQINGFFSIPIREAITAYVPEDKRRPLGVLNIHWDRCDRLSDPRSAKFFQKATFPLQVLLAQVLAELLADRPPEPDTRLSGAPASAAG